MGETMAPVPYLLPELIAKKRDGEEFTEEEIKFIVQAVTHGQAEGTQVGALLMAIYLKSMNLNETIWLTSAMVLSGETLTWPAEWQDLMVDKHSTGGVGDAVSLPLVPALAVWGLKVPMISGRGLGHTGGTLDKLESIPGFQVTQSKAAILQIMKDVGCCIVGQTQNIVPADRILYATRDVTSTVGSLPLISASIMSKKAAENLSSLVLDVKVGKGSVFTKDEEARFLAETAVGIGNGKGIKTVAVMTEMTNPIGYMVGNALEVKEAIQCLKGQGPEDLKELVTYFGGQLLYMKGKACNVKEGVEMMKNKLCDGSALDKFKQMIIAQGVTEHDAQQLCTDPSTVLAEAKYQTPICSQSTGYVTEIDSMVCASVSRALGAGRSKCEDVIDNAVGLQLLVSHGSFIEKGSPWVYMHHNVLLHKYLLKQLSAALTIAEEKPSSRSRIHCVID